MNIPSPAGPPLTSGTPCSALADHGSFEAAAAAQNRSQSSLSYALKRLQEQLPVAVLSPQGRRTVLTPQGELILQRARALLEEARALEGLAATLAQGWEPRSAWRLRSSCPRTCCCVPWRASAARPPRPGSSSSSPCCPEPARP